MQALDRILEILDEHIVLADCRECKRGFTYIGIDKQDCMTNLKNWKEVEKVFRKGNVIYEGVCPECIEENKP